jgi:hypothetical protein
MRDCHSRDPGSKSSGIDEIPGQGAYRQPAAPFRKSDGTDRTVKEEERTSGDTSAGSGPVSRGLDRQDDLVDEDKLFIKSYLKHMSGFNLRQMQHRVEQMSVWRLKN